MTAYTNAETVTALRRRAQSTEAPPETRRREITILRGNGRHLIPRRAEFWLSQYFDPATARGGHLPDILERWVREQMMRLGRDDSLPSPPTPLVGEDGDSRLWVRLIPDSSHDLLVLEQE